MLAIKSKRPSTGSVAEDAPSTTTNCSLLYSKVVLNPSYNKGVEVDICQLI